MKTYSNVIILTEGKLLPFKVSWFKNGKSKINKEEYNNYLYDKVINFGLFYIALTYKTDFFKLSIDFSSKLGILRIILL